MEDLEPGATAVDPPLVRIAAGVRGHHRRVTGLSGILLFACLFLPAVNACGQPVMPYEVPPLAPPYLLGGVFAAIAIARTARGRSRGLFALRVLTVAVVVGGVVLTPVAMPIGLTELTGGAVLLLIVGPGRTPEPRIATAALVVALGSMLWFGLLAAANFALLGAHLALASSVGLAIGAILWLKELGDRPPVDVPAAVARRGGAPRWRAARG